MNADQTDSSNQFRVVLRGYDPAEVDLHVQALAETARAARQQAHELSNRVQEIEQEQTRSSAQTPSFAHLGERVGWILTLAEDEAAELAERAQTEWESTVKRAHEAGAWIRDDADRYSEQTRGDANGEAADAMADARRDADELMAAAKLHLEQAEIRTEQVRAHGEQIHFDASREARGLIDAAQQQADAIVREAEAFALRVRTDSARELGAATQRRDIINAQLGNVRQMLATLSGAAPALVPGPDPDEEEPDEEEPDQDEPADAPPSGASAPTDASDEGASEHPETADQTNGKQERR